VILAHKIALDANDAQTSYFYRMVGTARFVYNWGLEAWNAAYNAGEKVNGMELRKRFNQTKYEEFPWLGEMPRDAHSQPFLNLDRAFKSFFKGKSKHPVFHKRGENDSCYLSADRIDFDGEYVRLPRIGLVRMHESLRFAGHILGAVLNREADRWFVSVQVEMGEYHRERVADGVIGIDLGITHAVTTSTGETYDSPKSLARHEKQLRRAQRVIARRVRGSANRAKAKNRLARLYRLIRNVRKDFLHKTSHRLCSENQAIGMESLNVKGMMANHCVARCLGDAALGELARQIEYKAVIFRDDLRKVDQWFASSKLCSECGAKKDDLSLSDRVYRCGVCGAVKDRDRNASENIRTASFAGTYACGHGDAAVVEAGTMQVLSVSTC